MQALKGSDVFLKEDVTSILRAIVLTNEMAAAAMGTDAAPYRQGFTAAVAAVATALDIDVRSVTVRHVLR